MFNKSILAVTAAALVTVLAQTPVQARDSSSSVRDHRAPVEAKVRDHRAPQVKVRDHRTPRKNEVVKVSRKDCRVGYENLRRSGYRSIRMLDCQDAEYSYLAQKNRALYGAKMNAFSGKVKVSYLGPVRKH